MDKKIERRSFGFLPDGREVCVYRLFDELGQSALVSEFGCALLELNVLDRDGELRDVVLGYDRLEDYVTDTRAFGATIGRCANRIAGGRFTLGGVTYHLPRNDGENHLHGGPQGFGKKRFAASTRDDALVLSLDSPHLEAGYPGNLHVSVTLTFSRGALRMRFDFSSDRDTPVSLTNHAYFNLNGQGRGSILDHRVRIHADRFCRAGTGLLPVAPPVPVEGPFDLREGRRLGEEVRAWGGYDHCFELRSTDLREDDLAAEVTGGDSGIRLEVRTDQPALQFYTGNQIGRAPGKGGAIYNSFDGLALECQQFPNAVNEPAFPSPILRSGEPGSAFIEYRFSQSNS